MTNPVEPLSPVKRAILEIRELKARLEQLEREASEPIAIIGLGCRFPGSDGPDEYWRLLDDGVDAIGRVPRARWDVEALFDADPDAPGAVYTREGGYLADVERFDAAFFGISPREAISLDPQQRLLLEVTWEALEHGGLAADRLLGSSTGVFIGISANEYGSVQLSHGRSGELDAYYGTGNALAVAAGRLSYFFGWRGPSLAIDTACSSSLVAVHLACQSLRQNECRMAVAGGVNLLLRPESTINFCRAHMLAPDGRCKTFDAAADGYSRGEGAGVVVLKRLSQAVADNDRVLAVVAGSAVNQDGRSGGLTVPNGPSQEAVIREALQRARLEPGAVSYIEAHGTGTSLGDPIEVHSLRAVFGPGRTGAHPLAIGSVKTNLGHLEAAAGIAGLIKIVLSYEHAQLPKQLHFRTLNPHISLDGAPIEVVAEQRPWPESDVRRVAGVSSFGFSGTNAHVVLSDVPGGPLRATDASAAAPPALIVLSARNAHSVRAIARRLAARLEESPLNLTDVAYTLATGRSHLAARAAFVAHSRDELQRRLEDLASETTTLPVGDLPDLDPQRPIISFGEATADDDQRLAILRRESRAVADAVDRLIGDAPALADALPRVTSQANDASRGAPHAVSSLVYQAALGAALQRWGIEARAYSGRGLGAIVAALCAGALTPQQAAQLAIDGRTAGLLCSRPHTLLVDADSGEPIGSNPESVREWLSRAVTPGRAESRSGVFAAPVLIVGAPSRPDTAWGALLETLGTAYREGLKFDWEAFYDGTGRRVALPTYPFERQRYWSAAAEALAGASQRATPESLPAAALLVSSVRGQIADALPAERLDVIVSVVREHLRAVLRLTDGAAIDRRHRLIDLGLDSLMVVEFRDRLARAFELDGVLPATLVFDYPNVDALSAFVETQLEPVTTTEPLPITSETTVASAPTSAERLREMSDEQAEALLLQQLESL